MGNSNYTSFYGPAFRENYSKAINQLQLEGFRFLNEKKENIPTSEEIKLLIANQIGTCQEIIPGIVVKDTKGFLFQEIIFALHTFRTSSEIFTSRTWMRDPFIKQMADYIATIKNQFNARVLYRVDIYIRPIPDSEDYDLAFLIINAPPALI